MTKTNILIVNPELAAAIGLNEALVLMQLHYWIKKNRSNYVNYEEGRWWVFHSYANWHIQFPFWSEMTIRRILASLERSGFIKSGKFNKKGYDHTKWYTIIYDNVPFDLLSECTEQSVHNEQKDVCNLNRPIQENNKDNNKESVDTHTCDDDKKAYGEYKWVRLSGDEITDLLSKYSGELITRAVKHLDRQAEKTGNSHGWKSWKPLIEQAIENNWGGVSDDR